jgi:hypothetical protein
LSPIPVTIYVAPNGDDGDSGGLDTPLATFTRARHLVRELKEKATTPVTVFFRSGTYYLNATVEFTPKDSGSREAGVTYAAYPGEKAVLSGAIPLTLAWNPHRGSIQVASVPEGLDFDQLFIAGARQMRARFPNVDPDHPLMGDSGYVNAIGGDNEKREVYYDPQTFTSRRWAHPEEAIVHIFPSHYWHNAQFRINDIDWNRGAIALGEGGWQTHEFLAPNNFSGNSRYFIDNVFEELDTPGEWYLDRREGLLYCIPPEGVDLGSARVEVPLLETLVRLTGSKERPVAHLSFKGFRITHTKTTFMEQYEVPSTGDWGIRRGGAILFEGAEDCAVEDSFFDSVGGNALFVSNHNRRINISGNTFARTGDSAVCLCGKNNMVEREWICEYCGTSRPWSFKEVEDYPAECTVSNNEMHHIGVYGKQTAGVFMSISRHNLIDHNHIHHMPRSGICINDPFWGGHVVEYNDIHETVLESDDHGPFNSWGRGHYWCLAINRIEVSHPAGDVKRDSRYQTIIRYNRFRDRRAGGITLDDGASNFHVYCNLLIGTGFQNREGEYRILENNILINPSQGVGYDVVNEENHDQFLRNIVVINADFVEVPDLEGDTSYKGANVSGEGSWMYRMRYPPHEGKWVNEIDYNLLYNYRGGFPAVNFVPRANQSPDQAATREEWQALGFDHHSVFGDPLFVDPNKQNFRVRPDSPAIELGFYNFDIAGVGLLPSFPDTWQE